MLQLTKEQKIQIIEGRRMIMARNMFELQMEVIVLQEQGRPEDVEVLQARIAALVSGDAALVEFRDSLE